MTFKVSVLCWQNKDIEGAMEAVAVKSKNMSNC